MSEKKQTNTTQNTSNNQQEQNQYNPLSQAMYNQILPTAASSLQSYIQAGQNPTQSPIFNLLNQNAFNQNNAAAQGWQNTLTNNIAATGQNALPNLPAFRTEEALANARALSGANANAAVNNALGIYNTGLGATTAGMAYQPLQTGYTGAQQGNMTGQQTETTSGLGTWLPAVASIGLGALTGGLGLIPGVAGGLGGALSGAAGIKAPTSTPGVSASQATPYFNPQPIAPTPQQSALSYYANPYII